MKKGGRELQVVKISKLNLRLYVYQFIFSKGEKMKKKIMKVFYTLFAIILSGTLLFGCAKSPEQTTEVTKPEEVAKTE